ncbi:unnamed protein product [Schistosoma margrebowiei]|uniref:Uncharacterized protein n=1 Tax=Schistosoma margrebowiei TaxID=48269 RepID=A0A183MMS0_9TREM|nr:unnamed protein product [Schistosoma margrebowiei]
MQNVASGLGSCRSLHLFGGLINPCDLVWDEISARIQKARLAFVNLRHLWCRLNMAKYLSPLIIQSSVLFFFQLYIQLRFSHSRIYPGVRTCFQMIYIALGLVVGYSRIIDNKHHWSDVLGGGLLGFFVALSTVSE